MENVLTILLAGGAGERLYPLTKNRAKPAVPFGGIYRIVDFTLSNCINSGLRRILVLTQYKSNSLSRHVQTAWNIMHTELGEFIDVYRRAGFPAPLYFATPMGLQVGDLAGVDAEGGADRQVGVIHRHLPRLGLGVGVPDALRRGGARLRDFVAQAA